MLQKTTPDQKSLRAEIGQLTGWMALLFGLLWLNGSREFDIGGMLLATVAVTLGASSLVLLFCQPSVQTSSVEESRGEDVTDESVVLSFAVKPEMTKSFENEQVSETPERRAA